MVKNCLKKLILMSFVFTFSFVTFIQAKTVKTENDKFETLVTLKIIEDTGNLDKPVTRAEFTKFLIRASKYRDKVPEYISENVCNDVSENTPYAPYIKKAIDEGYIFTYLGGFFKPNEFVTYSDLSRASLALLSYTNEDFRGNQVVGRNLKFRALKLDENIEKSENDILSKKDIIYGIYNTLKEKVKDTENIYGKTVFPDLIIDSDNEINASEYIINEIKGPYVFKDSNNIDIDFDLNEHNVYINGVNNSFEDLKYDIDVYGYAICYVDKNNKLLYAYTERQDIAAPVMLRKGYIYKIYYAVSNPLVPYRVDIDKYKYYLDSEEVKFNFSASGFLKEDDYIVYLCNKMNDVTTSYRDSSGNIVYENDEAEPYNGSIIMAYNISLIR